MTTGANPYVVPDAAAGDTDPSANVLETTLIATHSMTGVDIGIGTMTHVEMFNGAVPGPTFFLKVGDTVIVRLINLLDHPLGIHWHGAEVANSADGTEVTQEAASPAFGTPPPPPAPAGGTYLYKFKVPRPGLFWYHPHSHGSTNRVFRGLYGMLVVSDANEASLVSAGTIPDPMDPAQTRQLVLSDITVCKAGSNDTATYDPSLPWVGGPNLPVQNQPTPLALCEIGAAPRDARDEDGNPAAMSYGLGDVPSLIRTGQTNEGQTVLTNGMNVGGRAFPAGALDDPVGHPPLDVKAGQRLRLQIANCAAIRYFRLLLTDDSGNQVDLIRIGGEGGLLKNAVREGGTIGAFDTKYTPGEILLPGGSRADVVITIPSNASGIWTLWTQDFQRTGPTNAGNWAFLPTVPVMHLNINGSVPAQPAIVDGTPILAAIGQDVPLLGAPDGAFLNPPTPTTGMSSQDIKITTSGGPGIDGVHGSFDVMSGMPYTSAPHIQSTRWAEKGKTLQLTITNSTQAHHPAHFFHGFSIQPVSLGPTGQPPTLVWPYNEFRDNIDIPGGHTLTFKVHLADRELVDGTTMGGALGRWLFHCHIFFHHHQGMISELVVVEPDGTLHEKPNVDVHGSWAYGTTTVTRTGTYQHPNGLDLTLTATDAGGNPLGQILPSGLITPPGTNPGNWSWSYTGPPQTSYVYVTATDIEGRKDQTVFRIKLGGTDDGADIGDTHIHTVDGKRYDFQAVGEFTLLRDYEGMEIQGRQTPVLSANPVTDSYTGLTACVTVTTAVAARVGRHRIAYQILGRDTKNLQLFLDGRAIELPRNGLDLGEHRISAEDVDGGGTAVRIDYAYGPVVTITPYFWTSHQVWLLNVSVAQTSADVGIMGRISANDWLPALPDGTTVGPMPTGLQDRWFALYHTFADAWRVTDASSLFVYAPGTSTATFTDRNWPAQKMPCKVLPQFELPGGVLQGMPIEKAEQVCRRITIDGLRKDCVFDVATTGDEAFALGAQLAQELRQRGSSVQITADKPQSKPGETVTLTAIASRLYADAPKPRGRMTFFVDDVQAGTPVSIDANGRATKVVRGLAPGEHRFRAVFDGGVSGCCALGWLLFWRRRQTHRASSSVTLLHEVSP